MASRRDRLLQQLNITQWVVRHPAAFQGEMTVVLPADIRLILVSSQPVQLDEPLLHDILQALQLTAQEVYCLTPDQWRILPVNMHRLSWCLGSGGVPELTGVCITSPTLTELFHSAEAKRALWQQICHHEADIFPDTGRSGHRLAD